MGVTLVDPSKLKIAAVWHSFGHKNQHLAKDCPGGGPWPCNGKKKDE